MSQTIRGTASQAFWSGDGYEAPAPGLAQGINLQGSLARKSGLASNRAQERRNSIVQDPVSPPNISRLMLFDVQPKSQIDDDMEAPMGQSMSACLLRSHAIAMIIPDIEQSRLGRI